ncbi:MAG TPA: Rieske (2Fe-2S) protein [bacterium]|nr:Rieske (2Fe-2S) protein [bacterium]HMW33079.1 Rieske (2Fe-2S) protein [bacterium]HMW36509.1 Rieske (2Fe-2S) protein [bacterium]HMY36696.1 Rieske (2Fe-2S) protein [bacterium]HMZ05604.1 Rieske (2Fe-2S) protein [bacterium]
MRKFKVCKESEIAEGQGRSIKVLAKEIMIYRIDGQLRAYDGLCKHMRASLVSQSELKEYTLTCKWHGWQYDIRNGACLGKPDVYLTAHTIEITNGDIYVCVA